MRHPKQIHPQLDELEPVYTESITGQLEHGKIYISKKHYTSIHLCACGCGEEVVLPFNFQQFPNIHWQFSEEGTFAPSIGNKQYACRSHYFITNWKIDWLAPFGTPFE